VQNLTPGPPSPSTSGHDGAEAVRWPGGGRGASLHRLAVTDGRFHVDLAPWQVATLKLR